MDFEPKKSINSSQVFNFVGLNSRCDDLHLFLKAHGENPGKTTRVAVAVVDTFVWQALASVIIPGFTINRVCAASLYLLGKTTKWPLPVRKWTTTAIGLSTIPFIITPIDRYVFV